ncbi:BrnA antitoxin family protein [Alcaligenaceae bacterium]|nr:BrnA antitoxin family protein [Alcaligenaceae bacterium]
MSKKSALILPTPEEDEAINAGIRSDPDTKELSANEFHQLKPLKQRGRPLGSGQKTQITVRFDSDIIDAFKAAGPGWQTRMNDALKFWITTQHLSSPK